MAALNGVFSSMPKFLQAKAIKPDISTAPTLNIMTPGQVQSELSIGDAFQSGD
ncbi:conjugal transfer protein TraB [Orientia tsutsugamushi]|uniref:conjugal transfer protein TraB n=1 Tax=Orientia tsutsugamushi TaxID=784 RepID=UPI0035287588